MNIGKTSANWRRPNDPSVLILTSLANGAKHGYALSKDIEDFAGVVLSPGTLYGAITRLEESGLIAPQLEVQRRRPYAITAAGCAALAETVAEMSRIANVGRQRLGVVTWRMA
jgi:DNA-binding PadR family transcriptional regulator